MDKDKFLKAEEIARNLAETLVKLKAEIDLFKTTSENLRDVRESLRNIVSMLEEVARGHFKVVEGFLGLKGPEIVEKLEKSKEALSTVLQKLDGLEKATGETLKDIEEISGMLEEFGDALGSALAKLDDLKNSAGEMHRELGEISGKLEKNESELNTALMKLDDLKNSAGVVQRQLEDLSGRLESMENECRRSIGRVMMLIYFLLAFSALSVLFALLAFLR